MKLLNKSQTKVAILTYHRVSNKCDDWSLNPLPVESFEEHLKFLTNSYNIISLEDLVDMMIKKEPVTEKTLVLTFDDGYKDNYTNAYPLLQKYEIPATIFLTSKLIGTGELIWYDELGYIIYNTSVNEIKTGKLGDYAIYSKFEKYQALSDIKRKLIKLSELEKTALIDKLADICKVEISSHIGKELMLSWDEITEMDANNITFGAHTVNHPVLPNLNIQEAKLEILESKNVLEKNLNKPINCFSYPYGHFSQKTIDIVEKLNFKCAVTLNQRLINYKKDNLYTLSRMDAFRDLKFLKLFLLGYGEYFYNFVKLKNQIINANKIFKRRI